MNAFFDRFIYLTKQLSVKRNNSDMCRKQVGTAQWFENHIKTITSQTCTSEASFQVFQNVFLKIAFEKKIVQNIYTSIKGLNKEDKKNVEYFLAMYYLKYEYYLLWDT